MPFNEYQTSCDVFEYAAAIRIAGCYLNAWVVNVVARGLTDAVGELRERDSWRYADCRDRAPSFYELHKTSPNSVSRTSNTSLRTTSEITKASVNFPFAFV
jgi:hypothetical protein